MFDVFATIIIGDRAQEGLGVVAESTSEGRAEAVGGLGGEFGQVEIPTGSLKGDR
jgi:hypothetical protein